jgi:phosphoglycolate phosphatase-like HAD superfamily hydrolase
MPTVHFGEVPFDAHLVVFDKDGTLIDFVHAWGAKTVEWVEALVAAVAESAVLPPKQIPALRSDLYSAWGYDPVAERFASQGPMVTASIATLHIIAATVLYQHGFGWLDAEVMVKEAHIGMGSDEVAPEMLKPLADLPHLFGVLRTAGIPIAVVTSDDEAPTRRTLELLGVASLVFFVAGADSGYGEKPEPAGLLVACRAAGVDPARCVMVGDSTTDMLMATRAQVGLRVAVTSGTMGAEVLAPLADVILQSIAEIRIAEYAQ